MHASTSRYMHTYLHMYTVHTYTHTHRVDTYIYTHRATLAESYNRFVSRGCIYAPKHACMQAGNCIKRITHANACIHTYIHTYIRKRRHVHQILEAEFKLQVSSCRVET